MARKQDEMSIDDELTAAVGKVVSGIVNIRHK